MQAESYYIPPASALDLAAVQFLYCHRLGLPLPFAPDPVPPHCHRDCPHHPPSKPIAADHPLYLHLARCYHQLSCRVGPHRIRRHDALARLIAAAISTHLQVHATTSERLASSSTSGKKVDIVVTDYRLFPPITALDATVSCPMLPTYSATASADHRTLFLARAAEKVAKHLPGCAALGRSFLPIVFSTLGGVGPPANQTSSRKTNFSV